MKEIIDDPENSKLFMILEYCEKGEIKWKSEEGGPALTLSETRRIFRETLLGLEYRRLSCLILTTFADP
jgi:[calcium/calmodulin-dependent protein kinase] kinase